MSPASGKQATPAANSSRLMIWALKGIRNIVRNESAAEKLFSMNLKP
jgi:hypothetical protein